MEPAFCVNAGSIKLFTFACHFENVSVHQGEEKELNATRMKLLTFYFREEKKNVQVFVSEQCECDIIPVCHTMW